MLKTQFMRWIRWYRNCPWSWCAKLFVPLLTRVPTQDSLQTRVDISMLFILFTSYLLLWCCSHGAAIDVFPPRIRMCALPRNLCEYVACCFVRQHLFPRNYLGKLSSVRNIAGSTAKMRAYLQRKCFHTKHMKIILNIWPSGNADIIQQQTQSFSCWMSHHADQKLISKDVLKLAASC